ncbi:AAA family ATPase [Ornithinicoccus halotolerans]|uniref:AAA family ATPase n=1 Tax=Ornithinicoccus halotolerans TaxID=1748220 RepID=UPI001E4CF97A|nr:AAA family ATPase [Ornithinicoccus halotolerans]
MSYLDRIRTGAWLDAQEFPPMSWAVHGLIPEGFGLFTGPPKAGKSWAALGIGLAVASGTKALGKVPTGQPRPVLLLALEDGDRRLQGRCRYLLVDGEPIPPQLHYVTACTPGDVVPLIREWLEVHGHERPLVILDTLGKVMPPAIPGEGAYQRDYRIGSVLKTSVDQHPGSCLLVVHHTRKAGAEDWMDSTSGTNGLNGAADFTVNLSRPRNKDAGILRVTGRDVAEDEYAITTAQGSWTLDGDALADAARKAQEARAVEGLGDRSAEIVRYVSEHEDGVKPTDVAAALGMSNDDAGRYMRRLADAGKLTKIGRGVYTNRVRTVRMSETQEGAPLPFGHSDTSDRGRDCHGCGYPLPDIALTEGWDTHPACTEAAS